MESFNNLFSIGASGEFNYADSQILFHKSFDLVNSLTSRQSNEINEAKNFKVVNLNKNIKIGSKKISNQSKPFIIAKQE